MKTDFLKSTLKFMVMALIASTMFVSCNKDDDPIDEPIIVLDGLYLKVAGATDADLISNVKMKSTKNEVLQEDRSTLVEIYMALEAGSAGFNIVQVAGASTMVYGPAADFALIATDALDVDEPKEGLWKGGYEETATMFTVPEDGLYHIMLDTEVGKMAIAKVVWGLIGGATPGGWGENTAMTATFNKDKMEFMVEDVTMLENQYKFRYSNGWKVILDTELDLGDGNKGVKVNTNFGGSLTALVPGGDNIDNTEYAVYKYTMTWEKGVGTSVTMVKTGEGEVLADYPENLYMIGASIGGWDWVANGIQMIPAHSNPHLFWRIVWIESGVTDAGVKFAPGLEWVGEFGVDAGAGAVDGVWGKGADNLPDIATSGYYMVVVNLLTETVEVNAPMIYGIGDAFGSWDAAQAATMFTVDNVGKVITSPATTVDGNFRMHVGASTLTNGDGNAIDWWQAEFNVISDMIEYRGTGDDQAAVATTVGAVATLDFVAGTGTIL